MSMELRKKARELADKHARKAGLFANMDVSFSWVLDAIEEALGGSLLVSDKQFFRVKDTKTGLYKKSGNGSFCYNWSAGGKTWTRPGDVKNSLNLMLNDIDSENRLIDRANSGTAAGYYKTFAGKPKRERRFPDSWVVECHNKDGGWTKSVNEFMGIV